jgi:hypothetical protein
MASYTDSFTFTLKIKTSVIGRAMKITGQEGLKAELKTLNLSNKKHQCSVLASNYRCTSSKTCERRISSRCGCETPSPLKYITCLHDCQQSWKESLLGLLRTCTEILHKTKYLHWNLSIDFAYYFRRINRVVGELLQDENFYLFILSIYLLGTGGSVVVSGTVLQAGRPNSVSVRIHGNSFASPPPSKRLPLLVSPFRHLAVMLQY